MKQVHVPLLASLDAMFSHNLVGSVAIMQMFPGVATSLSAAERKGDVDVATITERKEFLFMLRELNVASDALGPLVGYFNARVDGD